MKTAFVALMFAIPSVAQAEDVSPNAAVDAFEAKFGTYKGKRRNHTKGQCFSATFTAKSEAADYTTSEIFQGETVNVVGRFSHPGGNLHSDDSKTKVLGMALDFRGKRVQHKMAMLNVPFFKVPTPEAFVEQLKLTASDHGEFNSKYHSAGHFGNALKDRVPGSKGYLQQYYNSIHTFYLVNKQNQKQAARWVFYPAAERQDKQAIHDQSGDFTIRLEKQLEKGPFVMDMLVSFPHHSDKLNDPTYQWITTGERVNFGRLQISSLQADCEPVNFDPTLVSQGFELSSDPVLRFRSTAYAVSFGKRIVEQHK